MGKEDMKVKELLKGKILKNVFICEDNKPIRLCSYEGAIKKFGDRRVKYHSLFECYEVTLYI